MGTEIQNHPHPNPLPAYRERGLEDASSSSWRRLHTDGALVISGSSGSNVCAASDIVDCVRVHRQKCWVIACGQGRRREMVHSLAASDGAQQMERLEARRKTSGGSFRSPIFG